MSSTSDGGHKPKRLPRGRHGLSREAVETSQRGRILEAVVAVVAELGYPETRVVDIITRAGVSRKTFYELFADKEDCFLAAYDQAVSRLYEGTELAFETASQRPWAERLRLAIAEFLGMLARRPELARFCIVEVLAAGPMALARRDAAIRQFTGFIDAGRAESKRELPGITALSLAGGINELLYSEIAQGASARLPARLPEIIFWVTQPYLGTAAAEVERRRARELIDAVDPRGPRDGTAPRDGTSSAAPPGGA